MFLIIDITAIAKAIALQFYITPGVKKL